MAFAVAFATCAMASWASEANAQIRVASCADLPEAGADLTSNPTFDIELARDPATANNNARLAFTLEMVDNNEVSLQINGGNPIVLDDVNAGGFEYARAYYFDFNRDNLNLGTNTISFDYTPGNGAVLRRMCIVLRDPDVPDPRPDEEIFCSSRPNAYNALSGDGPNSSRVDGMDYDPADLTIPSGAITDSTVIGIFGAVRANEGNESTTRTFHFRNNDNPDAEIVIDYSGIVDNETAVLSTPIDVTGFFPDDTPNLSMTSSHSANVHELCVVVRNGAPAPEPDPTPEGEPDDGGIDVDAGTPDGGGAPDGGTPAEPDPEPSGGPGVTPTPDTPTPDTPTPDTPTPDAPGPEEEPDTPTPDATPGVTPGPNVEPSPRPESGEPEGTPEAEVENPLGQGFAVSSCASSSAPGSVPFLFSAIVFAAFALSRRRRD